MTSFTKFIKSKRGLLFFKVLLPFAFISSITISLIASQSGQTGVTSNPSLGCYCHGNGSNNSATSLGVSSPGGWTVAGGGTLSNITLTVSNSNSRPHAGVDIAVKTTQNGSTNVGTLTPTSGQGMWSLNGELTHQTPKTASGGVTTWNFSWTAPSTPGTYYLHAAGNAVNDNGGTDVGDQWNWMSIQAITVTGPSTVTVNAPTAGNTWCMGTTQNITWTASGFTNVIIELSSDGGSSFPTTIVASTAASAGSYAWNIPSTGITAGSNFKIRISDAANSATKNVSGAFRFTDIFVMRDARWQCISTQSVQLAKK